MSTAEFARWVGMQQSITDLDNIRAILAIEQGDTAEAARIFKETLKEQRSDQPGRWGTGDPGGIFSDERRCPCRRRISRSGTFSISGSDPPRCRQIREAP